jgi:serine/threonine protein kinase
LYEESLIQGNQTGAAHYALCTHLGIGSEEDAESACDHYGVDMLEADSAIIGNAFRCLRSLNRAKLPNTQTLETVYEPELSLAPCRTDGCFEVTTLVSSYLERGYGLNKEDEISHGGSGIVTLSTDRKTGKKIAVKHVSVAKGRKDFIREVESLIKLKHPCVIGIVGWSEGHNRTWGEIHMELAKNHGLDFHLNRARRGGPDVFGSPTSKCRLICNIVLGMRYIHSCGIIHRDLKPSNILLDEEWRPKISDFGLSRRETSDGPPTANAGTVCYAAPEQWAEFGPHTTKTDVFSFGLVLYEIITGRSVFGELSHWQVLKRMRARNLPTLPEEFGALMQKLIARCWSQDPRDRPSFAAIFDQFEESGFALLPGVNADEIRLSVNEVLSWEARLTNQESGDFL